MTQLEAEKLVCQTLRLCELYVDIPRFVEFEAKLATIAKQYKIDLYQVYHGKSLDELKQTRSGYRNDHI